MVIRPEITVVAGLIFREGSFLIARRPDDDPLGRVWEFPGGKVEPGEALDDALARELFEELGIRARVGEEIEHLRHAYPHLIVELHFLRVLDFAGEAVGKEGQALAWVVPDSLDDYDFPAADAKLLSLLPALARRWSVRD